MTFPVVEELTSPPDVMETVRQFGHLEGVLLFDSARQGDERSQFSFLCADPVELDVLPSVAFGDDPFTACREVTDRWNSDCPNPDLPPFQGGYAGLLGYELGEAFEKLPRAAKDEFQIPAMAVGLYDWVIAWEHSTNRCWIISQGLPESDSARRSQRARQRLAMVRGLLSTVPSDSRPEPSDRIGPSERFPLEILDGLASNFDRPGYLDAVAKVVEYIYAGDIFQANLSQRLLFPLREHPLDLYERLRQCNPAPFGAYFSVDDWAVLSASPERFVRVDGCEVESRPIKGTRKRALGPEADLFVRDELRESDKDRAENVMIVDLMRNDLSRVCEAGSISVPQLCAVETYETVQHLVSQIRGTLRSNVSVWDLFAATFPGGSITGAPKIRAMEIIAELEPTVRGPYCGSLFYCSCSGHADSNILIRTFTSRRGWIQCPVGGGIVADSNPDAEYAETLHKAAGMLRALKPW